MTPDPETDEKEQFGSELFGTPVEHLLADGSIILADVFLEDASSTPAPEPE